MSNDDTYNGWANRETWAVALHINNDQGWQESVLEALREARDAYAPEFSFSDPEFSGYFAGKVIRENVESVLFGDYGDGSDEGYTLSQQQMGAIQDIGSLWRVNWDELGASFLSDLDES